MKKSVISTEKSRNIATQILSLTIIFHFYTIFKMICS